MIKVRERLLEIRVSWGAIALAAGLVVLLMPFVALPYLTSGGEVVEMRGVVVAPFAAPTGEGDSDSYYMRVRLESGREVLVPVPRSTLVAPGKSVVVTTRRGTKLGGAGYQFVRYEMNGT